MIDYPGLLKNINFRINPLNHLSFYLFYTKHSAINYMQNPPTNILMYVSNSLRNTY